MRPYNLRRRKVMMVVSQGVLRGSGYLHRIEECGEEQRPGRLVQYLQQFRRRQLKT